MKVLFLDPVDIAKDRYSQFLALGIEKANWNPEFISLLDETQQVQLWLDNIFDAVNRAEAIICFGNYHILRLMGDYAEDLLNILIKKANSGTPFLLHMIRFAENSNTYSSDPLVKKGIDSILSLFSTFEVQPSEIKVDMSLTHAEENRSPYVGYFYKSDGALRDPVLFKGVDKLLVAQPNLINYDGEVFPIIDATEGLNRYIDKGDLFANSLEGIKPAIGVVRMPGDEYQLILSGSYLADPHDIVAGKVKGIEENKQFAENIILALSGAAKTSNNLQIKCYDLFNHLERKLGKFVKQVLPEDKLQDYVSPRTTHELTDKDGEFHYEDSNFGHLCYMIFDNWTIFREYFPGKKTRDVKDVLLSVSRGPRRHLAHPHRGEELDIKFNEMDIQCVENALQLIQTAIDIIKK